MEPQISHIHSQFDQILMRGRRRILCFPTGDIWLYCHLGCPRCPVTHDWSSLKGKWLFNIATVLDCFPLCLWQLMEPKAPRLILLLRVGMQGIMMFSNSQCCEEKIDSIEWSEVQGIAACLFFFYTVISPLTRFMFLFWWHLEQIHHVWFAAFHPHTENSLMAKCLPSSSCGWNLLGNDAKELMRCLTLSIVCHFYKALLFWFTKTTAALDSLWRTRFSHSNDKLSQNISVTSSS